LGWPKNAALSLDLRCTLYRPGPGTRLKELALHILDADFIISV